MSFSKELYRVKKDDYYSQERMEMLPFVPKGVKTVLDIGCSSGGFGKILKENLKCEVWGIEPTEAATEASKHLDKVFYDYFHKDLDFSNKKFDAIIFNDVLEHLIDPWESLTRCKTLLTPNGCIIASIPNVQCYSVVKDLVFNGHWKYQSSGILDKTHLRFFTKRSIFDIFSNLGFEIISIEGQNSILKGSRLLRFISFFIRDRIAPFTFINYALCARLK